MHSNATRSEFLRLRLSGMSFARISRELGVSRPTLIGSSRQCRPEIASPLAAAEYQIAGDLPEATNAEINILQRRLVAVKQELFSRAVGDIPASALERLVTNEDSTLNPP